MYRSCVPASLTILLLGVCLFFLFPSPCRSVPVLKDGAKFTQRQASPSRNVSGSVTTLGSYRDISRVKKVLKKKLLNIHHVRIAYPD